MKYAPTTFDMPERDHAEKEATFALALKVEAIVFQLLQSRGVRTPRDKLASEELDCLRAELTLAIEGILWHSHCQGASLKSR